MLKFFSHSLAGIQTAARFRESMKRLASPLGRIFLMGLLLFFALLGWEIRTSRLQAWIFSHIASNFNYHIEDGVSGNIRFPSFGPYDIRLGYVRIPEWIKKMNERGYDVVKQARWSPALIRNTDLGLFTIYREKTQGGLSILDRQGRKLLSQNFPERIYRDFNSLPPVLARMIMFIENRHLLDTASPHQNPAIEWERAGKAVFDAAIGYFDQDRHIAGGSTMATQLEKFRHSPRGVTDTAEDKLRQVVSATLRTYYFGTQTLQTRRQILLDYVNSIPLAAVPGFGEVLGLGDGLWAWYGLDFNMITRSLADAQRKDLPPHRIKEAGKAIKSVLSLFLAQRRPSAYLITNRGDLEDLTNAHLRLLANEKIISPEIRDAALSSRLNFQKKVSSAHPQEALQSKAANFIRSNLMATLGIERAYDLDRLDLEVGTGIDLDLQRKVTQVLSMLKDPLMLERMKLKGPHLLERGDPSKLIYSFSFYERTPQGNMLRVQTNNYDGFFNIDEQMKLDMGSSAKLRVLVNYLDIMAGLHGRYSALSHDELSKASADSSLDPLSRWVVNYLLIAKDKALSPLLEASMNRRYSAGAGERFFTGGGLHTFANFNKKDNFRIMTVSEAFRQSVNLVFIRMMKDIVYYYIYQRYSVTPNSLEKLDEKEKRRLLVLFADKEGIQFIMRFYGKYRGKSPGEIKRLLFMSIQPTPFRLAAAFRFLYPEAPVGSFEAFINEYLPGSHLSGQTVDSLYHRYDRENFSLADTGYIAQVHPLELWLAGYLQSHPGASLGEAIQKSAEQRQAVYQWLFKTKNPRRQYMRIRTILELEAFQDIHREWKRFGYPFDFLVPSYASAIGSSGDRPGALAELMGVILSDGVSYPRVRVESLHFGKDTPYETKMVLSPPAGRRIMPPEAARIVRLALRDVVEEGTAIHLKNAAHLSDGSPVAISGKTGTGDHRYKVFGPGGTLISSKVLNRTAIFVFTLGDRHFGTISAYVSGPAAADYSFSSALPLSVLKILLPDLVAGLQDKPI